MADQARLGRDGPLIGRVGLGSWELAGPSRFGWGPVDDDESIATIRHAIESGVDFVDTAAFYGRGHSEEVVGRALEPFDVGEDVLVFTKCGLRWDPASDPDDPPTNNLRPASIRYEVDMSLKRLGLDRIDLYQCHWPDRIGTPVEESWGAMTELVDEGKVRWLGVSNFDIELLERCERIRHVDSLQPPFNLLDRRARAGLTDWCVRHGTGVLAYSPMSSGLLTGSFSHAEAASLATTDWRRYAPQFKDPILSRNLALVDEIRPIAARLGATVPELVIAWVLHQVGVTAAIVGAKTPTEVDGWIRAPDVALDETVLHEIEQVIARTGAGLA
ncbi:MAG: aldo/keto reductase [Actinomycetota bacterium]|nr:aldo/keto reductase [Actinomycetota bacterium]